MLGAPIATDLARELRGMMRCEVTFVSGTMLTGTTHESLTDQKALVRALGRLAPAGPERAAGPVIEIGTSSGNWLTVARRIPGSDPARRQFYVLQRSFDPETSFLRLMRRDMALLAAIALVAALFTGLLFAEQILRPIQRLVRGAQEMERGNYDHPMPVRERDELGYLTERFVEMRQRERAYLDSLEQATKLKSQFLSMASHELRTPISVLRGYRDVIAAGTLGPVTAEQKAALATMQEHLARLTRLAEDAGRFARLKSERIVLDLGLHDLATVVRNAVSAACTVGADRTVNVETRIDPVEEPFVADAESLEQAIFQIVTNAIRFTPDGGRVHVQARCDEDRLRIVVSDTGVGITPERMEALFVYGVSDREVNKHHSAEGLEFNAAGLGLGLSVARAIVEAHGGKIEVSSVVGKGSTFIIDMPLRRELEEEPAA
jgi:signal transduction histidine kinase